MGWVKSMKEWYRKSYIDRRTWLLENAKALQLTPEEFYFASMVDYLEEFGPAADPDTLVLKTGFSREDTDRIIGQLSAKGYLRIEVLPDSVRINLDGLFAQETVVPQSLSVLPLFEQEFGRPLNHREIERLVEWQKDYTDEQIVDALRQACIYKKRSMNYIEKVLGKPDDGE